MKSNFLIFTLLLCLFNYGQSLKFDEGYCTSKDYYQEINFELVLNKIVIPVKVNGKNYRFWLDTGAPTMVSEPIYQQTKYTKNKIVSLSDANNKKGDVKIVKIKTIELGSLIFKKNTALVFDFESREILKCFNIDGIIGSNFFSNSVLSIDLKNKKIIVTNDIRKLTIKSKGSKMELHLNQKMPIVDLKLQFSNGILNDKVLIDTGMEGYYDAQNAVCDSIQKYDPASVVATNFGANSIGAFGLANPNHQKIFNVNIVQLNNTTFTNVNFYNTDDNKSRIGLDFFKFGTVTLDFINQVAYFDFQENIKMEQKTDKFELTFLENQFIVGLVWDEELSKKIAFGDKVISIDNYNAADFNACELFHLKQFLNRKICYQVEVINKNQEIINLTYYN
jgi:hypothetical protein